MKIRVLMIATSLDEFGGISIQAARLREAFAANALIEAAFLPNNPRLSKPLRWLQRIKFSRTFFTSLKFWWSLLITVRKYDVIHIFSAATSGYLIATLPPLFCAKLFGKKTILNYHSGEAEDHIVQWKRTALPTMRMFDAIVVPSGFLVYVFGKFGLKAEAIANFIDTDNFKFRRRAKLEPIFLSNRNFEWYYDVGTVIRAFDEIKKTILEARLTIAGYGSERKKLEDLVAELKLKGVRFVGKVSHEEMAKLYDAADVYLNSSVVDNMPLSIIEAFACGIPVVSTDAGGIPYLVSDGETGLLAAQKDHRALARNAVKLLNDRELAQRIIAAARRESEKYTWEKVKAKWENFYIELNES